jgi:RND family efflux transporter MFP subunit
MSDKQPQNPHAGTDAHSNTQTNGEEGPKRHEPLSKRKALILIAVGLILAVVLGVLGIVPRLRAQKNLQQQTDATAAPPVVVLKPSQGKPEDNLSLPGALQAYIDSPIYARTSGYLKHWYFDIGAHVRKGQLLADIESPEVDQQLAQGQADLATAEANARNAAIQAKRYQDLLDQNAVSQQDTDNFVTQQLSTNTQVKSAQANVDRLKQLVGFEHVYAPFDGVVTARDIDVGQLINAGASTNQQLFEISQTGTLRVYVAIPQTDTPGIHVGMHAQVTLTEFPGKQFDGRLVRTAGAIDPTTRTLLVEVDLDNHNGMLLPGSYAQVHFQLNTGSRSLLIPVSAMIFQSKGLQVAVVRNGKAYLVPITAGQNDGKNLAVLTGLNANDEVIQNPPDALNNAEPVRVVTPQKSGSSGSSPGGSSK